eukprot:scaffold104956_cov28-Tisochrysis_lutea.AAC.8
MGAGKTTVILPLLAFFLADGSQLIMQAVLRERFSSFISKPIYTFSFDRSTVPSQSILDKLRDAERSGGLVCATPTALKSFALAFVYCMHLLDYQYRRDLQKSKGGGSRFGSLFGFFGRSTPSANVDGAAELHEQVREPVVRQHAMLALASGLLNLRACRCGSAC